MDKKQQQAKRLKDLKVQYLVELKEYLVSLQISTEQFNSENRTRIITIVHRLKGSSPIFGFQEIGHLAGEFMEFLALSPLFQADGKLNLTEATPSKDRKVYENFVFKLEEAYKKALVEVEKL